MHFSSGNTTLESINLAQVSTISHKGTLGLFPLGKRGRQRFVVGDDSGSVQCFDIKRGEAQTSFSYRFADGGGVGASCGSGGGRSGMGMITAVAMGGLTGGPGGGDRVFATQGSSIVGLSKKGKDFFKMASPLSETIHHLAVEGERIWTGCDYICSGYDDGRDAAFYMCHDRIGALVTANLTGGNALDAVLGCQDHCVRVIRGDGNGVGSEVTFQASVEAPVGAVCALGTRGGGHLDMDSGGIIYGTDRGTLGHLGPASEGTTCLRKTWHFQERGGAGAGRGITALKTCDLTRDGTEEIIAGREDGTVTVYRLSSNEGDLTGTVGGLEEAFSVSLGESVRSLEAGMVSSDTRPEVIACTFRGRVCSLTTPALDQGDGESGGGGFGRSVGDLHNENRVKQLKKEVADLEKRVTYQREKLATLDRGAAGGGGNPSPAAYTQATQHFDAITSCVLDREQGAYVINVETPGPLDVVLLRSNVHMDLLDSSQEEEDVAQASSSVTSLSPENGGGLCATYRFDGGVSRLRIRARTTEGDYGDVKLTVVANTPSQKSAQVIHFCMKPLSLHRRLHDKLDAEDLSRRLLNSLILQGSFAINVLHDWLAMCLPDVPPRVSEGAEEASLHFENVFTGGILTAKYSRGEAILRSDSASTLAIVKELVSKEATARRVRVTDTFQAEPDSIKAFLNLLHPKLTAQFVLARQVGLTDALQELSMQEPESPWMFEEYRYILDNADQMKQEFKGRPRALEYISGIITDLYVDWHKFRGDDARHRIPELEQLLAAYDFNTLVSFFLRKPL